MAAYLAIKTKNMIKKACGNTELEFDLKNININGNKRGCSGFVRNKENGVVVYIDTERCSGCSFLGYMFRYAKDFKDYTGCINQWRQGFDSYITGIKEALQNEKRYNGELISCKKVTA